MSMFTVRMHVHCKHYNNITLIVHNYNYVDEYPPPEKLTLSLVNLGLKQIAFTWSPVAPNCHTIHYNILASNCGNCPTNTTETTVTCTDVPTDRSMCSFGVQTVIRGNITGNVSEHLEFNVTETFNEMANPIKGI